MGKYYYLAPQLSYLIYGQAAPMSSGNFIALAHRTMSSEDAELLAHCTLGTAPANEDGTDRASYTAPAPATHSAFINHWKEWERALILNLARGRAQKLNRDAELYAGAPDFPLEAVAAAKAALALDSPLEAEILLDKARWSAIEQFQGLDIFSENAMYAYLLKLLLLERRAAFDTEEGFTEYKALYTAILGEAK